MSEQSTRDPKYAISVTVYVRGDDLDPGCITKILGILPTMQQRKGDKIVSQSGQEYERRIGIWSVRSDVESSALSDYINGIILQLSKAKHVFTHEAFQWTNMPGVEEAYLDIFMCKESVDPYSNVEFEISDSVVNEVAKFKLPVRFTIGSAPPLIRHTDNT